MLSFPVSKINIGLNVLNKRPDGYHEIQSVFYPVNLCDALEILPCRNAVTPVSFQFSGLPVPGDPDLNLVNMACKLIQKNFEIPSLSVHLHKVIPMGAGLGGGSSDGAYTLRMLNELFSLGLTKPELRDLALQLGSDCPFFIDNQAQMVGGRGELLQPVNLDLSGYIIVLVCPGIHVQTREAFANLILKPRPVSLSRQLAAGIESWKELIHNDFEDYVFARYPEIGTIKQKLYKAGAVYASMTGSGSAVYGIFDKQPETIEGLSSYFCWTGKLD
jgi:4-diphosphocytidyl-2-C-methyl-D-erythritol kinase